MLLLKSNMRCCNQDFVLSGKRKHEKQNYWKDIAFAITLYNDVARSVSNLVVVLAKRHRVNRHGVTDSSTLKNQNNNNTDSFSSVSITTTPISSFFFFQVTQRGVRREIRGHKKPKFISMIPFSFPIQSKKRRGENQKRIKWMW